MLECKPHLILFMFFFEGVKKIYFLGIGGIGMSALARLLKAKGYYVYGSDISSSSTTKELECEGIKIFDGHNVNFLDENTDLLIFSEAVSKDCPEIHKALALGIPSMSYFEALGKLTESYRLIAIAGTHGKSTTTSMLALILTNAGLDPTVVVGTKISEFGNKNVRVGDSDIFLVEACEYRRNFLHLRPSLLGILNIELDHLDYYKNQDDYQKAFDEFAAQSDNVIWPDEISEYEGELGVPGQHNLWNAGLAAAIARKYGVSESIISSTLKKFSGTWRRFEYKGTCCGASVYDDYAHHPSEIHATLEAAREKYPDSRIIAFFQPHQYSRTAKLLNDFAESFDIADEVLITDIYEARDNQEDIESVNAEILATAISKFHDDVRYCGNLKKSAEYLLESLKENDVLLVMGAGDVYKVIPMILDENFPTTQ